MAFLPGIFGRANAPAPAPAATPAAVAGGGAGPATKQAEPANPGANPATMNTGAPAPAPAAPANPLDNWTSMFQPKQVDPNAPKQPTLADPLLGQLDPAKLQEQVSKTNFAASIPQDKIQAALNGDANAFLDAINAATQAAFMASAQLSHGLAETGARTAAERLNASLDGRIRNFQIKSQNPTIEALSHPAVSPMLSAVKAQIAQSNPQLTPEQVQTQAETYFTQMAEVLTAPKQQAAAEAAAGPKQQDFSYLLQ